MTFLTHRMRTAFGVSVALVLVTSLSMVAQASAAGNHSALQDGTLRAAAHSGMGTFLVVVPHGQNESLASLDPMLSAKAIQISKWEWGVRTGNYTGYEIVKATDAASALSLVPTSLRANAHVTQINHMNRADLVNLYHQQS